VEKKAVVEAIARTGARETFLIEEPRAAALGAGLNILNQAEHGCRCRGGTSDIAVLSMGEVVEGASVSIGGDKFDEAIIQFVKKDTTPSLESGLPNPLKMKIGSAHPASHSLQAEVRGRDLVTGLPRSVTLSTSQVVQALEEPLWAILQGYQTGAGENSGLSWPEIFQ